jgi:hypothetical protein
MHLVLLWPTVPFPPAIKFSHGARAITDAVKAMHYASPAARAFPQHQCCGKCNMIENAAPAPTWQCTKDNVPAGWRILEKSEHRHEHEAGAAKEGKTCEGLLASGEEEGRRCHGEEQGIACHVVGHLALLQPLLALLHILCVFYIFTSAQVLIIC